MTRSGQGRGTSYLATVPNARRLLVVGAMSRLGMGMTPLALILSVIKTGNGFGAAGLATGVYGLAGAGAGPLVGRLPFELVFLLGPALVSAIVSFAPSGAALVFAAFVTGAGSLLVALNPLLSSRATRPGRRTHPLGPLRIPGFVPLVATSGALGITFGAVTVAVTAFADRVSANSEAAGFLLALWGLGSIIGGGLFARRPPRRALQTVLAVLLCLIAASTLLLAATSGPIPMGVVLGLGGLAVAPAVAAYTTLANSAVPADVRGEANTWLVTIPAATQALGSWIAGLLVARFHGPQVAFVVAGAVTATSLIWLRRLNLRC